METQSASVSSQKSQAKPKRAKAAVGEVTAKEMARGRASRFPIGIDMDTKPARRKLVMQTFPTYAAHKRNMDLNADLRDQDGYVTANLKGDAEKLVELEKGKFCRRAGVGCEPIKFEYKLENSTEPDVLEREQAAGSLTDKIGVVPKNLELERDKKGHLWFKKGIASAGRVACMLVANERRPQAEPGLETESGLRRTTKGMVMPALDAYNAIPNETGLYRALAMTEPVPERRVTDIRGKVCEAICVPHDMGNCATMPRYDEQKNMIWPPMDLNVRLNPRVITKHAMRVMDATMYK